LKFDPKRIKIGLHQRKNVKAPDVQVPILLLIIDTFVDILSYLLGKPSDLL